MLRQMPERISGNAVPYSALQENSLYPLPGLLQVGPGETGNIVAKRVCLVGNKIVF